MTKPFTLHAMAAGTLPVPGWVAVFGDNQKSLRDLGFYVWLITDGDHLGLIDLGLPLDAGEATAMSEANRAVDDGSYFRDVRLLPALLTSAGVSGADIDFVAITQTVTYHTGGLDPDLLPNARFFLSFAGVREMLLDRPGHPATEFYFTSGGWNALRSLMIQDRVQFVDEATEMVPGAWFEPTGGHHPGSAGVRVRTGAGWTGLLETAFVQDNLDRRVPIGIAEDIATCRSVIHRWLDDCDEVVAIHEPSNADRFPLNGFETPSGGRTPREERR